MYTSHGHQILNTPVEGEQPPVARCGGPGLCALCSHESIQHQKNKEQTMQTTIYIRKPFEVEAVEVTEENLEAVESWCTGEIKTDERERRFVKVRVNRPLNERQTRAYPGDWVLYAGTGFKVYTPKAFKKTFVRPSEIGEVLVTENADATTG